MSSPSFQSLRGMPDVLPPESDRWLTIADRFRHAAWRFGYHSVRTPILEELAVFARAGEGTDVVAKEMYEFVDRDGTTVALRPESTAGVARAFVQHRPLVPWKVWYFSEHFRHERPQAGRLRQHHQFGAECFGSGDPDVDTELIVLLWDFLDGLGLSRKHLELNSIGDPASRLAYTETLRTFLRDRLDALDPEDRAKVESHPMRVLDSKRAASRAATEGAPTPIDSLTDEAGAHFERVTAGLAAAGIPVTIQPRLVRGLDYYTHTVFEVVSDAIDAAQSTVGGGGRYDGLVESLGGPPTPAVGFGSGIERILLALEAEERLDRLGSHLADLRAFVVTFGGDGSDARDLCTRLRREGHSVERSFDGRSGRAQMKQADRSGARFALVIGDDERAAGTVTMRDLRGDAPQEAVSIDRLSEVLWERLAPDRG
ncbi:MAG: histidine--tRNA ligase [Microthrixaceae bacterium]|nr:histidine--tRNA ligase [Microthrixaceae bacterium]HMS12003.1 histidine--tRNA ligase [Microthrixaceae bacterium]HMT26168.1 histidine--tRNA ligase [Microthrixaceae bacterium]HMT61467.1 histidine--tRNA ligase [Microthrixaceae bacterium]